jgi:16S rRNA (uracil1498-N3)-methyltransferase
MALCRILRATPGELVAEVEERTRAAPPVPQVSVLLAPPKGDRLSWAIQKLTEVGTDRLVLIQTGRSVRRWGRERGEKAVARAAAVAREAAKQARRRFLPEVAGPVPWPAALEAASARGPVFLLWEGASTGLAGQLPDEPPEELTLVVGPEGGILEEEAREAEERGARLAALGTTILRTETAALAGASIALSRYGRLGDRGEPLDPSDAAR